MSFKNRVFNELTCTKYLKKKTIFPFIPRVSTTIFLMNRTDFSQNFWLEKTYAEKCIVMKLYYFLLFLSINWKKKEWLRRYVYRFSNLYFQFKWFSIAFLKNLISCNYMNVFIFIYFFWINRPARHGWYRRHVLLHQKNIQTFLQYILGTLAMAKIYENKQVLF